VTGLELLEWLSAMSNEKLKEATVMLELTGYRGRVEIKPLTTAHYYAPAGAEPTIYLIEK